VILAVAIVFTLTCALASARRLKYVLEITAIDAGGLASLLRPRSKLAPGVLRRLEAGLTEIPEADWERELVTALGQPPDVRPAFVGETLTELDFRARRWSKVPRVAASLASSFGFLLATVALRVGLSGLVGELDDERVLSVNGAVLDALDVAAVGLVGAAICIAIHYRARSALASRLKGIDQLVELLESAAEDEATPLVTAGGHATVATPFPEETLPSPVV